LSPRLESTLNVFIFEFSATACSATVLTAFLIDSMSLSQVKVFAQPVIPRRCLRQFSTDSESSSLQSI